MLNACLAMGGPIFLSLTPGTLDKLFSFPGVLFLSLGLLSLITAVFPRRAG